MICWGYNSDNVLITRDGDGFKSFVVEIRVLSLVLRINWCREND